MRVALVASTALLAVAACGADAGSSQDGGGAATRDLVMVFPHEDLTTPDPCRDGLVSPGESDVDCGGSCAACDDGKRCAEDKDCLHMLCIDGTCRAGPTCMDGQLDGDESDVDCGGSCAPCPEGRTCIANKDCAPRVCRQTRCQSVTPRMLAFAPAVGYGAVGKPRALAAGDIDGDKNLDVVTFLDGKSAVGMFKGRPNGTFEAMVEYPSDAYGRSVIAVDLDGDGRADVATGNRSNSVSVLLSRGGVLAKADTYGFNTEAPSVDAGDVDGDGRIDLVMGMQGGGAVLPNIGGGKFGVARALPPTPNSVSFGLAAGDVNGDGKADIVIANGKSVFLILGSAKDPLVAQWMHGIGRGAITLARLDGDKLLDFAFAEGSSTVTAFMNDGNGGFRNQPAWPTDANFAAGMVHADFNTDGWEDVAIAGNRMLGTIAVVLNDGAGGWRAAVHVKVGSDPWGITTGDFDHDGLPDIAAVISDKDPESLQVLLNRSR